MARDLRWLLRMKLASLLLLAPLTLGCTGATGSETESLTHAAGACGEIETHVIGVYQAEKGTGTVELARKGKHALVLSSHDAMTWHIKTSNGAVLEHVYAVGYGKQTVVVDGAKVDVISDSMADTGIGACGYSMSDSSGGCDANSLMILAGKRVHHDVTSFHGCYKASAWRIGGDMGTTSNCAVASQDDWAGGCKDNNGSGCGDGSGDGGDGTVPGGGPSGPLK